RTPRSGGSHVRGAARGARPAAPLGVRRRGVGRCADPSGAPRLGVDRHRRGHAAEAALPLPTRRVGVRRNGAPVAPPSTPKRWCAGLLDRGAIGLVTTHDLAIAAAANGLATRAANVHFEDQLSDGRVTFDYRVRPGVVTKTNALELMRAVGLEV